MQKRDGKLPAIIIDLDGTLCNTPHLSKFKSLEQEDYGEFLEAIKIATKNRWCVEIIKKYVNTHRVLIITGRSNYFRTATQRWLEEQDIPHDYLYMRQQGDDREDTEIKKEIYDIAIKDNFSVEFAIDDRGEVVKMWRGVGIVTFHCASRE